MAIQVSERPFPSGSNFDPRDLTVTQGEIVGFESVDGSDITCTSSIDGIQVGVFVEQNGSSQFTAPTKVGEYTVLSSIPDGKVIVVSIDGGVSAKAGANGKLRVGSGS